MIYGFYLQNVVLFRIKPNSEDPNKEPTWWDKIRNQEWFTFDSKLKKSKPFSPSSNLKKNPPTKTSNNVYANIYMKHVNISVNI